MGLEPVVLLYVYDGDQIIAEYDGSGSLIRKYVYGAGIDEPVQLIAQGSSLIEKYWYHADGLGSITELTDEAGNVAESYEYDVYGQVKILDANRLPLSASQIGNSYMFTGREFDSETGLYYYRARYYNSELGRFLQTDPVGYGDSMNLYSYCGNNGVNWVDPWGNFSGVEAVLGGALVFPEIAIGIGIGLGLGVIGWSIWQIWELSEALDNADSNPEEVSEAAKTQGKECPQGEKSKSKIDRNKAAKERSDYWKDEAMKNPDKYSPEDLERMEKGKPPIGPDGKPVELHHQDGTPSGPKEPMTRTDHRLGDNYFKNHPWLKR